jgi:hypothetical protein
VAGSATMARELPNLPLEMHLAELSLDQDGVSLPPVTPITSPTTNRDSSEARNTYADASSAGCACRPIGLERKPRACGAFVRLERTLV